MPDRTRQLSNSFDRVVSGGGASAVDRLLAALQGESLNDFRGVLHLAAVWQAGSDLVVMAINQDTPKSDLDFFLLEAGRAWSQALVTTGKILRDEPELSFELQGPAAPALSEWRQLHGLSGSGVEELPTVVVLTSGRGFDPDHPAFSPCHAGRMRVVLLTGLASQESLEHLVAEHGAAFEVVAVTEPGTRSAVEWLRQIGVERISVEAGPSSSSQLYLGARNPEAHDLDALALASEPLVDRLSLSRYTADSIPETVKAGRFLAGAGLSFLETAYLLRHSAEAGNWGFERWEKRK